MMPRQCYIHFFWGMFLAILDLKFNGFDILPDFVGYILIALAASRISTVSPAFHKVVWPSIALVILDLTGMVADRDFAAVLGYLYSVIDCFMIWFLLGAVAIDCSAHGHFDLVAAAGNRRRWYIGLTIALHAFVLVAHDSRDLASALVVVGVLGFLILLILVLSLLRSARLRLFGH